MSKFPLRIYILTLLMQEIEELPCWQVLEEESAPPDPQALRRMRRKSNVIHAMNDYICAYPPSTEVRASTLLGTSRSASTHRAGNSGSVHPATFAPHSSAPIPAWRGDPADKADLVSFSPAGGHKPQFGLSGCIPPLLYFNR